MVVKDPRRVDPQQLTPLRRRFLSEIRKRFARLQAAVWELVVKEDAFGLQEAKPIKGLTINKRFAFDTNPRKVDKFTKWFQEQVDLGILKVDAANGKPWTAEFVESSYRQAAMRSYTDVHKEALAEDLSFYQGSREQFLRDSFTMPQAVEGIELLSTRAFENLKGVTAQMAARMNRELADGFAHGRGPLEIARKLRHSMNISKHRAETIARTELAHAYSEGQLDSFERLGVEEVGIEAEWLTAGDEKVCPQCAAIAGNTYTVEEARGMLPLHPNCRCAWVPVVSESVEMRRAIERARRDFYEGREHGHAARGFAEGAVPANAQIYLKWQAAPDTPVEKLVEGLAVKPSTVRSWIRGWKKGEQLPKYKFAEGAIASKPIPVTPPAPTPAPVVTPAPVPTSIAPKSKRFTFDLDIIGSDGDQIVIGALREEMERMAKFERVGKFLDVSSTDVALRDKMIWDAFGKYEESSGQIVLKKGLATESGKLEIGEHVWAAGTDLRTTFRHEYGHKYWFEEMTIAERDAFYFQFDEYYGASPKKFITTYGAKNESELFAECFTIFTHPEYKAGVLPKDIETFMDEVLRKQSKKSVRREAIAKSLRDVEVSTPQVGTNLSHLDLTVPASVKQVTTKAFEEVITSGGTKFTTQAELRAAVKELLDDALAESDVWMRVPSSPVLEKILDEGAFKNQFQVGKSKGLYDPEFRKGIEKEILGVPMNIDNAQRPVYGYLSVDGSISNLTLDGYGSIAVKFKSSTKSRTTFTIGDSIDNVRSIENGKALQVLDPNLDLIGKQMRTTLKRKEWYGTDRMVLEEYLEKKAKQEVQKGEALRTMRGAFDYIETQIHGGVQVDEIEFIIFKRNPSASVKRKLKERGIQWRLEE